MPTRTEGSRYRSVNVPWSLDQAMLASPGFPGPTAFILAAIREKLARDATPMPEQATHAKRRPTAAKKGA